jgi:hypothetical protein
VSDKIYIDFIGGSHGNFLQFFCNRFLAGIPTVDPLPFNDLGASHSHEFTQPQKFIQDHYTTYNIKIPEHSQVISIHIGIDDLLAVQCISLLRAGDYNINPTDLSHDTWNKLNNPSYKSVLDNIFNSFFRNQIRESYLQIMDPSWPMIETIEDFQQLPEWIKTECEEVHDLKLLAFGPDHPNCPESVLYEFFKIGFLNPEQHGFIVPMKYDESCDVYRFPFSCFYNWDLFSAEIKKLSAWCGMAVDIVDPEVYNLHKEFVNRQPYKDTKSKCDLLVNQKLQDKNVILPELNVIERAYIDAQLEKQ